ncbi:DsrE family protein [Alkalimonas collagenimarina]|uniref:DsrE family protein n=1 Tax=Alkalimonas collagenimarina TaxID=400390 RepID=A0ABT9H1J9_9GAMM|nr:DsrE family protein [Alkalimonas collagenimarina]MDP4537192.1 DsrE family protein [Alkalimonas collagenimarina]
MTSFVILLTQSPFNGQAFQSALRFASSSVAMGHCIDHIFLYQDAVLAASDAIDLPADEPDASRLLAQFCLQHQIPLLFCSTAAEKRGLSLQSEQLRPGYQLAGLAEHAMRLANHRLVQL